MAIGSGRMSPAGMLQQLRVLARGSFGIPLLLLTVLAMMTLPIPPLLLDALFSFNIALSLVVLLVAVYALRPLDFAVFPTILLVTTLLRQLLPAVSITGLHEEIPSMHDIFIRVVSEKAPDHVTPGMTE